MRVQIRGKGGEEKFTSILKQEEVNFTLMGKSDEGETPLFFGFLVMKSGWSDTRTWLFSVTRGTYIGKDANLCWLSASR